MDKFTLPDRRLFLTGLAAGSALAMTPRRPAFASTDEEEEPAGTVARIRGAALAVRDAVPRVLAPGAKIFVGDVLSTGPDARLEITMIDEGIFTLGAKTSFTVLAYTFGGGGNAVLRLMSGAVNAVSGQLAKKTAGLRVESELATIGIRGTKFWIGEMHGTLHVAHWTGGGVEVSNRAGKVFLADDQTGTKITGRDSAPTPPEAWPNDMSNMARQMTAF